MGRLGLKIAKDLNIPCVCTVHTRYKFEVKRIAKSEQITKQVMKSIMHVFNKCDKCFVVNDPLIKELKDTGYKKEPIVIYNGTELTPLQNREKNIQMVNKLYDLKATDTVLLFVGRLVKTKNIYFLLDSLKLLKEDNVKFKMIYVGIGPEEKKLKNKIKDYGMQEQIIMAGELSNREILSAVYARADLLLLPSIMDTSSLVRIEAAVNGTAGLFIKDSMVASTIKDNINGYTAELEESKYKDKIKEIISNKKQLKKVSKNAKETLGKTWLSVADELYVEYLKLIENKG
jgi:glycosyltransferase involved in cell wall biosynthesis